MYVCVLRRFNYDLPKTLAQKQLLQMQPLQTMTFSIERLFVSFSFRQLPYIYNQHVYLIWHRKAGQALFVDVCLLMLNQIMHTQ